VAELSVQYDVMAAQVVLGQIEVAEVRKPFCSN